MHPYVTNGGDKPPETILLDAARSFTAWLKREGYASHDPYDVWGTKYGMWARRVYYKKKLLGLPLIAPILALDLLWPQARRFFVEKMRYATADAQLVLAFLNLYEVTGSHDYLEKAVALAKEILDYQVTGYSGPCWGYPFAWQNNRGAHTKNVPFITCTPYCFEAFLELHKITGEARYRDVAEQIANFIYHDLNDTPAGPDALAASYSPNDHEKVVNCSAYRAYVLLAAAEYFKRPELRTRAQQNINFILQSQRPDGSWLYAVDHPGDGFIDHFHTCFVLKNLFKLNRLLRSSAVEKAILKGYRYYRDELFDANNDPRTYAIQPRTQIVRLEMYNFAEAITLGVLLRDILPQAFDLAQELAHKLVSEYQLPDGHFVTRVYLGGLRHKQAFLRWPQAQLFYAITNLLAAVTGEKEETTNGHELTGRVLTANRH